MDPIDRSIVKLYATSSGVGKFKLLNYSFLTGWYTDLPITNMVVFDMTFIVVVLGE